VHSQRPDNYIRCRYDELNFWVQSLQKKCLNIRKTISVTDESWGGPHLCRVVYSFPEQTPLSLAMIAVSIKPGISLSVRITFPPHPSNAASPAYLDLNLCSCCRQSRSTAMSIDYAFAKYIQWRVGSRGSIGYRYIDSILTFKHDW